MRMVLLLALFSSAALGAGEEVYKAKCSLCHDAGATQAPRIGEPGDWARRVDKGFDGLLRSALQGIAGTAMLPKAGFPELSEADVASAVRYMVSTMKLQFPTASPAPRAKAPRTAVAGARRDDAALIAAVAQALRERLAPRARIDTSNGTRIDGILVEARDGRVSLSGVVRDAAAAAQALQAARSIAGVTDVEDKLVPAALFEHD